MQYYKTPEDLEIVLIENIQTTYEKHNHVSKYILGMVLEGEIWLENQCEKRKYVKEDVFTIPIYQVHELAIANKETRVLTFCIGKEFWRKFSKRECSRILDKYWEILGKQGIVNSTQLEIFKGVFLRVFEEYSPTEYISGKSANNNKNIPLFSEIDRIRNLLEEQPENETPLELLSNEFYLSKYYLLRKFKEQIGLTPHKFQMQNRIRRIQHLLEEGWNTADAATEMGFYDQSHFHKCFRKVVKLTPKAYVKAFKKLG